MRRTLDVLIKGAATFGAAFLLAAYGVITLVQAAETGGIPGPSGHLYGYPSEAAGAWLPAGFVASAALVLAGGLLLTPLAKAAIPRRRRPGPRLRSLRPRRSVGAGGGAA
jgi:hypothetical protein